MFVVLLVIALVLGVYVWCCKRSREDQSWSRKSYEEYCNAVLAELERQRIRHKERW